MVLEFENKIYRKFLLLTKKRYAAQCVDIDDKIEAELNIKGIQIKRRDGCKVMRDIYEYTILAVFADTPIDEILDHINQHVISCPSMKFSFEWYVLCKEKSM